MDQSCQTVRSFNKIQHHFKITLALTPCTTTRHPGLILILTETFQSYCCLFSSTLENLVFSLSSSSCPCSWSLATFTYPHSGSCTLWPSSSLQPSPLIPGQPPCSQLRSCCVGLTKPKLHCSQGELMIMMTRRQYEDGMEIWWGGGDCVRWQQQQKDDKSSPSRGLHLGSILLQCLSVYLFSFLLCHVLIVYIIDSIV